MSTKFLKVKDDNEPKSIYLDLYELPAANTAVGVSTGIQSTTVKIGDSEVELRVAT
jgi:hypothetical protein